MKHMIYPDTPCMPYMNHICLHWGGLGVNVGIYGIHGVSGIQDSPSPSKSNHSQTFRELAREYRELAIVGAPDHGDACQIQVDT